MIKVEKEGVAVDKQPDAFFCPLCNVFRGAFRGDIIEILVHLGFFHGLSAARALGICADLTTTRATAREQLRKAA